MGIHYFCHCYAEKKVRETSCNLVKIPALNEEGRKPRCQSTRVEFFTNYMEHSPWKAYSRSVSQEIPHLFWNSILIIVISGAWWLCAIFRNIPVPFPWRVLAPNTIPNVEDGPLLAIRYRIFNTFGASLIICHPSIQTAAYGHAMS
jgi:hypothetical protein